ncbi:MAG: flagellin [Robiginitomaculum sp.]|nr:MAG: flagellin [Robiginitomaculum sp.]
MTISVNTNTGALIALQNLNVTNRELEGVQTRISTGYKVANAKDNGGAFAIAQKLRGDVGAYNAVGDSLSRVQSIVDVASAAGTAISDLLVELKEKALAASDTSLDSTSRTALNEDFKALRDQIASIVTNATFNGVNLINNSTASLRALASADGTQVLTILDENLSLGGTVVTIAATEAINTVTKAAAALTKINASITNLGSSLARLGTKSKALDIHATFVSKLQDATIAGIGNLVDADLAKESARLQALQVKQQLGVQALSIANQAPSIVLSFFQ